MPTFPVTEIFRNFETDATPPAEHHFTLNQDVPSGYTLIYEGGSTVGSSGVPTTTLNGSVNNVVTSIVTASAFMNTSASVTDGFFVLKIDSEYMLCSAGKAGTTLTVQRGFNGTTAASHLSGATVTGYDGGVNRIDAIGGGTWSPVAIMAEQTNSGTAEVWTCYCPVTVNHLTTTLGVLGFQRGVSPNCRVVMVPGQLTVDQVSTGTDSFTTSHTTANLTTTNANDLLVGIHEISASNTWTPEVLSPAWSSVTTNNPTDGNMMAFQDREVVATGTYESSGTTTNNCGSNAVQVAFAGGPAGQTTGIAGLGLGLIARPDTQTGHEIHVRGRKANVSEIGLIRLWLYESNVLRSGPWDVQLTDVFTTSRVQLPDADAALIGNYANLEMRMQGVAPSGAITPQISFVELQTPGSSAFNPGVSSFPNFEWPSVRMVSAPFFRPGAMTRTATDLSIPVPAGGSNVILQTLTAVSVAVTATIQNQVNKLVTATAVAATASIVRQINKTATATTVAVTASIQKQVAKPLTAATVAVTGAMQRQVNKTLAATSVVVTASLQALKVILKALTATAVIVTASMQKQVLKNMTATTVGVTASMVRQVNKLLTAASITVTATMQRQVNKALTATSVAVTASLQALKVILKALTATAVAVTASMQRQTLKNLTAASVVVTATMQRSIAKTLSATVAAGASISRTILKRMTSTPVSSLASMVASFISGSAQTIYTKFFGKASPADNELDGGPDANEFGPPGPRQT